MEVDKFENISLSMEISFATPHESRNRPFPTSSSFERFFILSFSQLKMSFL